MSGETEAEVSAWTVDSIREHFNVVIGIMDARFAERDQRFDQRFEAQEKAVDVALTAMQNILTGIRDLLDERDKRYQDRADALDKASHVAIATLERDFQERIRQVRDETVLAMSASEKAIEKAEVATEKRFSSVNEFRAQQADIIQTFARKSEVDSQLIGLAEKVAICQVAITQLGGTTMPRNEYDRAHGDLADKVLALDKALSEKLEAHAKAVDGRIALLQSQVSNVEAITR